MKNILLCIFILVFVSTVLAQTNQNIQTDSIVFKEPKLILEAVAGDKVGQFGIILGMDINWPIDFVIDPKGAIWIMDGVNKRVQKFDANGNYILSFPNDGDNSSVKLICKHIECTRDGIIVLGPTLDGYVLLNNNGTFLRNIKIPGAIPSLFDFSVIPSGDILYLRGGDVIALNLKGEVIYVTTRDYWVDGKNVSPYSKYIVNKRPAQRITNIYDGSVKENNKINTIEIKDIPKQEPNYTYSDILITDNEGNLFVRNIKDKNPSYVDITIYKPNLQYIQKLQNPEELAKKNVLVLYNSYAIDSDGNFYLMHVKRPENTEIKPFELIKSSTPCLRIWKWERVKE